MTQTTLLPKTAISGTTPITGIFKKLKNATYGGERIGSISLQLVTDGSVAGAWHVLASNKIDCDVNGDSEAPDITAAFITGATPTAGIATVTGSADATQHQGVQAGELWFSAIGLKFVPTSGVGNASGYLNEAV